MSKLRTFGQFWYDFVVGDDWTIAVAVIAAVALTAVIAHTVGGGWIVIPVAVATILWMSLRRSAREYLSGR